MSNAKAFELKREKPEGTRFVSHIGGSIITDATTGKVEDGEVEIKNLDFSNVKYTIEIDGPYTESVTMESESKVWTDPTPETSEETMEESSDEGISSEVEVSPVEEKKDGRRGKRNR